MPSIQASRNIQFRNNPNMQLRNSHSRNPQVNKHSSSTKSHSNKGRLQEECR